MNDGIISPKGLRDEWSLLLHTFLDDSSEAKKSDEMITQMKASPLTLDQIKGMRKDLSSKRKKMNQSIEKLKSKIEQMSNVVDNLELVGSDTTGLVKEINMLNNEGEQISEEIIVLDQKIKKLHELQDLMA
ncbi:hypothetical protein [Pseudobdellovibrio exovorus]|uniref:Uncharacterized protein n=1 Tax=Pseudobdellovibrio exovorus JSS TaxID=1184267 RepID=M4VDB2_9BACT|nr:hypothetical protein [Pseudobdellovibrio exovorus]AGH96465.1 hypothetical protein A11Q_2249 [Pseudobdellovibrio exovorus JSS]